MTAFVLLRRFWWAVPMLALIGYAVFATIRADRAAVRADAAEATARAEISSRKQVQRQLDAMKAAEAERTRDAEAITDLRKDLSDAVVTAPMALPAPSSVALGCARLRRQGDTASADYRRLCR